MRVTGRTSAIVWVSRPEQGIVGAVRFDASRAGGANSLAGTRREGGSARRARSSTRPGRVTLWSW